MSSPARRGAPPSPALTASMAGAIDLGALKARSDAATRAASQPARPLDSYVIDVSEESFQADVLDRSFQVPVLIDLWADWCQPCKQLSPILEQLAQESAGSWILAKIDVDANPRISQALQVQSIPSVFAVIGGQLVPGFQGALPADQVREFVDAVVAAGQQAGLSGAGALAEPGTVPEEPVDPRYVAAEAALDAGDYPAAIAAYETIIAAEPANAEAALALRQVKLIQRAESLDPSVLEIADGQPDDVAAQLRAADFEFVSNDLEAAFDRLLGLLRRSSGEERDQVRDRLVEYFELAGPDDPRVGPARRGLTNALF